MHMFSQGYYCCDEIPWSKQLVCVSVSVGIWHMLPHHWFSSKEVRKGTQTGQGPRSRSWCRSAGGVLLPGLLLLVCSPCSYGELRITSLDRAPLTVAWALSHQPLINKRTYKLAYSLLYVHKIKKAVHHKPTATIVLKEKKKWNKKNCVSTKIRKTIRYLCSSAQYSTWSLGAIGHDKHKKQHF